VGGGDGASSKRWGSFPGRGGKVGIRKNEGKLEGREKCKGEEKEKKKKAMVVGCLTYGGERGQKKNEKGKSSQQQQKKGKGEKKVFFAEKYVSEKKGTVN